MNTRSSIAAAALLSIACAASAGEPLPSLPPVQAVHQVFDCRAPRSLPPQAAVGEWLGLHNVGQVYAARGRLMGDVARACRKPGVARVDLVLQRQPAETAGPERQVARIEPRR
jgi:hypothetical protein